MAELLGRAEYDDLVVLAAAFSAPPAPGNRTKNARANGVRGKSSSTGMEANSGIGRNTTPTRTGGTLTAKQVVISSILETVQPVVHGLRGREGGYFRWVVLQRDATGDPVRLEQKNVIRE